MVGLVAAAAMAAVVQSMLHEGQFSQLWIARMEESGRVIVLKRYPKDILLHHPEQKAWRRALMQKHVMEVTKQHPSIFLTTILFAQTADEFVEVGYELVGLGDLYSLMKRRKPLTPAEAMRYAGEITLALAHLHSFDIIYGDLSPENVLVDLDGHIKLGDFGSSRRMTRRDAHRPPEPEVRTLDGCTPEYVAPERLLQRKSCEVMDLWSLGVLLCELLCGETPFYHPDPSHMVHLICRAPVCLPQHANIGAAEAGFLLRLLDRDVDARLGARPRGATAVLEHEWFGAIPSHRFLSREVPPPLLGLLGQTAHPAPPASPDDAPLLDAPSASAAVDVHDSLFAESSDTVASSSTSPGLSGSATPIATCACEQGGAACGGSVHGGASSGAGATEGTRCSFSAPPRIVAVRPPPEGKEDGGALLCNTDTPSSVIDRRDGLQSAPAALYWGCGTRRPNAL